MHELWPMCAITWLSEYFKVSASTVKNKAIQEGLMKSGRKTRVRGVKKKDIDKYVSDYFQQYSTESHHVSHHTKKTLCWSCVKATGGKGCPWVGSFEPVPGWDATPSCVRWMAEGVEHVVDTYRVHSCPMFEPDPPRNS